MIRKWMTRLALVLPALPLILYPGVLMAGIMGLAAQPGPNTDWLVARVARSFLIVSMLYPLTLAFGFALLAGNHRRAGMAVLWGNMLLCFALFGAWYAMSIK